jgi:inner membrane transporter RhtA
MLVLAAIGSVQTGASLAVTLFDEAGPAGTSFLRVAIAAVILWALVRPRLRRRGRGELALAALFGLLLAGMNTCFYLALDRIPQGGVVTLEFAGPLAVALALSRRALDIVWVVLAAGGIALLSGGGLGTSDPVGIGFALAAGCLWGGYILAGARLVRSLPGMSGLTIAMAVGAVALVPGGVADAGGALGDPAVLGIAVGVAVLSSVIPYSFELEALRRMPQRVFGVLMSLEPAVAVLAGFAILGQSLSPLEGLAIGFVVVASAGVALTGRLAVEPADVPAPAPDAPLAKADPR